MDRQYVGIDFHRRRSVIVRKSAASAVRIANEPSAIASAIADAGPNPQVVIEATDGWYWIVDWLQEQGATVHLANPSGLKLGAAAREERRARRDRSDRHAAARSSAGGVDRAAGHPGTARVGALSGEAGRVAVRAQGAGACGHGQSRRAPERDGHVRSGRQRPARSDAARERIHDPGRVVAGSDRAPRPRGHDARGADPQPPARRSWLSGDPSHQRHRPNHGCDLGRRNR
jgi:hypothetical protein